MHHICTQWQQQEMQQIGAQQGQGGSWAHHTGEGGVDCWGRLGGGAGCGAGPAAGREACGREGERREAEARQGQQLTDTASGVDQGQDNRANRAAASGSVTFSLQLRAS